MAFTWTGDPAASDIEKVRWEVYDIDSTNAKFQDAEIQYAIDQEYTIFNAAARLCEQLQGRYTDAKSRTMGPLKVDMGDLAKTYAEKAKALRKRAIVYGKAYAGGASIAKEELFEADSSLKQPIFSKGMMDNT